MTDNVVTPFGNGYKAPGPCEEVIERLKQLLEEAERGEITGFAYGLVRPNDGITHGFTGGTGNCVSLLAAATLSQQMLVAELLRE